MTRKTPVSSAEIGGVVARSPPQADAPARESATNDEDGATRAESLLEGH